MFHFKNKEIKDLFQWDTNVVLVFEIGTPGDEVHFSNNKNNSYTYALNKNLEVQIPNFLLTKPMPIEIYLYIVDEDGSYTKKRKILPVLARPKPENYVSTDEVKIWDTKLDIYQGLDKANTILQINNQGQVSFRDNTYTTLSREKTNIKIHFHNLNPNKTYKLYLYTVSRYKGSKYGIPYHPYNYDIMPSEGSDKRIGYGKLAGHIYGSHADRIYDNVPKWKPNNGFLITEWDINNEENSMDLDLTRWLAPMIKPLEIGNFDEIKPIFNNREISIPVLMLAISKGTFSKLAFWFCLVDDDGKIYPCYNTLKVGPISNIVNRNDGYIQIKVRNANSWIDSQTLHTSII